MASEPITVMVDQDLEDLIPGFMENRLKDLQELRDALAEQDFAVISAVGHRMKGTGGGFGFEGISTLGSELEDAAGSEDTTALAAVLDRLADYLERVEVKYE